MSKTEFKELHLSDERLMKPVDTYSRRRNRTNRAARDDDEDKDGDCTNKPHDNIYIIIRKKRASLPLQVDW